MIVREIERRGGVRTERLVDYATGKVVANAPPRAGVVDAWTEHWSDAMGARTAQDGREIKARCRAAGLDARFRYGAFGPLKVNNRREQKKFGAVVRADIGRMVNFDDC